jgi:hypothetical protein
VHPLHVHPPLHPLQPHVGLLQPALQVHPLVQAPQLGPEHPPVQVPLQPFVQLQAQLTLSPQEGWQADSPSVQGPQPAEGPKKQPGPCGNTLIIKSVTLNVPKMSSRRWTKIYNLCGTPNELTRNCLRPQGVRKLAPWRPTSTAAAD